MGEMIAVAIVDLKAGPALDWAVSKATMTAEYLSEYPMFIREAEPRLWNEDYSFGYSPSTDWAHGGTLIELMKIKLTHNALTDGTEAWLAASSREMRGFAVSGETALEAICKFIASAKFGDAVLVPRALLEAK